MGLRIALAGATALALQTISLASAQLPEKSPGRSDITAKGVSCGLVASRPAGRLTGASPNNTLSNRMAFRIEKKTKDIPAKRGVEFGMLYTLKNFLGTGTTPVRVVFTYPEPGLRNPKTGKISLSTENTFVKRYDIELLESYTFEEDWEIVPGTWRLQVFDHQKQLAECTFSVAKPE